MKFETYMLRCLFAGCLLVCGLILVAMIEAKPQSAQTQVAMVSQVGTIFASAPTHCALPAFDLVCLRAMS